MSNYDLTQKDYEEALKSGLDPKIIPEEIRNAIWKENKEIAFESISNGHFFSYEAINNAPQKAINSYVKNNGDLFYLTIDGKINQELASKLPKEDLLKAVVENNRTSEWLNGAELSQSNINQFFANGHSSYIASKSNAADAFVNIPQNQINQGVAKGGSTLIDLYDELENFKNQKNTLSKITIRRSLNKAEEESLKRADKMIGKLSKIISNIPESNKISYYENGGKGGSIMGSEFESNELDFYLADQTPETANKYIANGGDASQLSSSQLGLISKETIIERASNFEIYDLSDHRDKYMNDYSYSKDIPLDLLSKVPDYLKKQLSAGSNEAKSLALFAAGRIQLQDLSSEVFVHPQTRKALLKIVKTKNPKNYDAIKKVIEGKQKEGIAEIIKEIERGTKIEKFAETTEGQDEIKKDEKKYSSPETLKGKDKKKPGEENTTEDQQTI